MMVITARTPPHLETGGSQLPLLLSLNSPFWPQVRKRSLGQCVCVGGQLPKGLPSAAREGGTSSRGLALQAQGPEAEEGRGV